MSLGRAEIGRVLAEGAPARAGALTVAVAPGRDRAGRSRLGLAVRTGRGAVVRNRVRRRLKEAFRAAGVPGRDVVVRADEAVLTVDFQELVNELTVLVRRAEGRS